MPSRSRDPNSRSSRKQRPLATAAGPGGASLPEDAGKLGAPAPATVSWRWVTAAAVAITIIYLALRLPGLGVPLDRDEGAFGLIGQIVNRGGLPYRDGLDIKPPLTFYIYAFALHFVPATPTGVHAFLLVYNFTTLLCLAGLARMYFRNWSAALWSGFAFAVFTASPAIQGFTASTEMFAMLPAVLSLLLAVFGMRRSSYPAVFFSGIMGAAACWTKQPFFTIALFVFLFVCIPSLNGSRDASRNAQPARWSGAIVPPALWLGGALMFSAAVALYFWFHGIFSEFIYWCFTYEASYASAPLSETLSKISARLSEILRGDFVFPAAGIIVAILGMVRREPRGYFLAGFLVLSFAGTIPGYAFPHYFVELAPAVALAGGYAFSCLLERIPAQGARRAAAVVCAVLIVAITAGSNREYFFEKDPIAISRRYFGNTPFTKAQELGAFIASASGPGDRVLVVGAEPEVIFYSERQSETPFVVLYPLTRKHARYREFQEKLLNEVRNAPPKYIVAVINIPTYLLWDGQANLDFLQTLNDFASSRYTLEKRILLDGLASAGSAAGGRQMLLLRRK